MNFEELQKENEKLKRENQELSDIFHFLLAAVDNIPNPIFIKNENAEFAYFNKKYEEAFGITKEQYIGKTVLDMEYLSKTDRENYQKEDCELIQSSAIKSYDVDFVFADGKKHPSFYWSKGFVTEQTRKRGIIGEIVDISKERILQDKLDNYIIKLKKHNIDLEIQTETDAGTGIYNRSKLSKISVEQNEGNSIIMMDIDHFKDINDRFGHLKGDEILSEFSELLKGMLREGDTPIRYGGEEFLVILKNCKLEHAVAIADQIRQSAEESLLLPNQESVTVSMGVSEINPQVSLNENIERADQSLYCAKNQGRNRVISYDDCVEENVKKFEKQN